MYIWFAVYALSVPMLVFSASPASERGWRLARNKWLFAIGYIVTCALLYQHVSRDGSFSKFSVHWFFVGWFWLILYIGFWEGVWRLFYHYRWKKHGDTEVSFWRGMRDDWFSTCILFAAMIEFLLLMALFISLLTI